jgi:hypothetical protein
MSPPSRDARHASTEAPCLSEFIAAMGCTCPRHRCGPTLSQPYRENGYLANPCAVTHRARARRLWYSPIVSGTKLDGGGRRTAGRGRVTDAAERLRKNRKTGERQRTKIGLEDYLDPFEHLAGRARPRAEGSRVGGSLVMRVVRGVRHRLGIHQPAEEQEADGQADRNNSSHGPVHLKLVILVRMH